MSRFPALFAVLVLLVPVAARAEDAPLDRGAVLAQKAEQLLEQGDVDGAHKAYRAALVESPEHPAYLRRAAVLKRVARLRRFVAKDDASERWTVAAATLHDFYLGEDLAGQVLELDRTAHARLDNAGTSIRLGETLLALQRDAEARKLLEARSRTTFHERVLLGIALARLGKVEEAAKLQAALGVDKDATPVQIRDLARLNALLGARKETLALLRTALENTPKEGLAAARKRIEICADFAALRDLPAYREVLTTRSKVVESCSGGSDCGSCPSRGDCNEG